MCSCFEQFCARWAADSGSKTARLESGCQSRRIMPKLKNSWVLRPGTPRPAPSQLTTILANSLGEAVLSGWAWRPKRKTPPDIALAPTWTERLPRGIQMVCAILVGPIRLACHPDHRQDDDWAFNGTAVGENDDKTIPPAAIGTLAVFFI